jgi:ribosome maturation factor RimP
VQASVVGGASVTGRVVSADDSGVTLDVDGTERVVGYAELGPGKVQVEFNRPDGLA